MTEPYMGMENNMGMEPFENIEGIADILPNKPVGECVQCGRIKHQCPDKRYFCRKNHEFCEICFTLVLEVSGCISCRQDIGIYFTPMNIDLITCNNRSKGCRYEQNENEETFEMHKNGCRYRMLYCECKVFGIENCHWYGYLPEVEEHFIQNHPDCLWLENNFECKMLFNLDQPHRNLQLIKWRSMIFLYKHLLDVDTQKFYVSMQVIDTEKEANRYFFSYKIKNNKTAINAIINCHSDSMPFTQICEERKCVEISMKTLRDFVIDGRLWFRIDIALV